MTLKFKSKDNYCSRHERSKRFFLNCLPKSNSFLRIFSKSSEKNNLTQSTSAGSFQADNHPSNRIKNRVVHHSDNKKSSLLDDQSMIDELNSTCVACLAEDNNFSEYALSREQMYNRQPSVMFKYHIGMCSLVFLAISAVLFVADLQK